MGRGTRAKSDQDVKEVQKLRRENVKLKGQISSLRKQLSRIDLDRYTNLRDIIEAHELEDDEFDIKESLEESKKKWECFDCKEGILNLIMITKCGDPFYLRRCNNCGKKTRLKKYDETVKGIKAEV